MLVFSGLNASWIYVHAGASGSFLTGTSRGGTSETDVVADTSIDQMLARELGASTPLASLELSIDKEANAGQCTSGLSCAYTQTISWRTPTMPLPMENNPRAVFERLFGDSGSTDPAVRLARMQEKRSILDSVMDKLADVERRVGTDDRRKVDEYAAAIRDVERRIEVAESRSDVHPVFADEPRGVPSTFEEHVELMFDLQFLALRSDITRVATFMLGREQSTRTYPEVGINEPHHPLSHHGNDPAQIAKMSKVNTYHAELTSRYLERLRATPDQDGSLLDNMTIMYGTCMSNSTRHAGNNVPILVLGGCARGGSRAGGISRMAAGTTHANLLLTLLDKFDVRLDRLGGSTGALRSTRSTR